MRNFVIRQARQTALDLGGLNWLVIAVIICITGGLAYWLANSSGSVIAAGVALSIALVLYPWQKERDRRLKIAEELRAATASFMSTTEEIFTRIAGATSVHTATVPDVADQLGKAKGTLAALRLYINPASAEHFQSYLREIEEYRKVLESEKSLRPDTGGKRLTKRPDNYRAAAEVRYAQFVKTNSRRNELFTTLPTLLQTSMAFESITAISPAPIHEAGSRDGETDTDLTSECGK